MQPISELAEIKDDAVKCDNHDDSPTILDDSSVINNYSPTNNTNTIISSDSTQNKEGYSACLKLIEKFQEVVMDSAVRVIQAAFKRFRERKRFLRIKKAVMVIQRNLRKWLETKHPCIRPADFERQSSDGSKSDEYRETVENESEECVTEEKDEMENIQLNNNESEKCQESNDTNGNESLVENNMLDNPQENTFDVENVNAELQLNDKTVDMQPTCLSKSEEEQVEEESSAVKDKDPVTMSAESEQEIVRNEKSLLGEVTSNFQDSDGHGNKSEELNDLITAIDTTDICSSGVTQKDEDFIETQENPLSKANIEVEQDDLHCENENQCKTTAGDDLKDKEEEVLNVTKISPDSLKVICQKSLHSSEVSNSHNTEDVDS